MIQISAACRCHSVGDTDVRNLWNHRMIEPQNLSSVPAHTCCKIPQKRETQVMFNAKEIDYFSHIALKDYKFCKYYLKIIPAKIYKQTSSFSPQHSNTVRHFMSPPTFSCFFQDILPPTSVPVLLDN